MSGKIESRFLGWKVATRKLEIISKESEGDQWLNDGQRKAIAAIIKRIPNNGVLIADEVGMGKTRIAVALARAVTQAQGRVAILIPAGLGYQWKEELRGGKLPDVPDPIRSLGIYFNDRDFFNEPIVLISHLFANWRHRENSNSNRFAFLPEMYACIRNEKKRLPRNYKPWTAENSTDIMRTKAQSIVQAIPKEPKNPARMKLSCLNDFNWDMNLFRKNRYIDSKDENLKIQMNACVSVGLGIFDLIILDEAHKNRKVKSGLSKLLDNIICREANHRVLGLTATPVELEAGDWLDTLKRIGVSGETLIEESIIKYAKAVKEVRGSWLSPIDRENFKTASKNFEKLLKKYLIRRDKREDTEVIDFQKKSGRPYSQYREEKEISIDPAEFGFPTSWRKAICGAEALSFVSQMKEDPWSKRFRLTLANGHGLSAWIDQSTATDKIDLEESNLMSAFMEIDGSCNTSQLRKRKERLVYWKKTISKAASHRKPQLYYHPAIIETIKCIEENYIKKNQKVLVFGKFTKPMQALVSLLNAREMVRRLDDGKPWPQFTIREEELSAVNAALDQLKDVLTREWDIQRIRAALIKNSYKIESSRKKFRKVFLPALGEHFKKNPKNNASLPFRIYEMIRRNPRKHEELLTQVTRACYELIIGSALFEEVNIQGVDWFDQYQKLIYQITDTDLEEGLPDESMDIQETEQVIETMKKQLGEEYAIQSARFARFMFGGTKHHSRRLMQLGFNRPISFPFVLVAQSKVGREGLNLHKACKTVIMLHPEWNPAVAEQQIGRVDRLGSLWAELIKDYHGNGNDIPRIEIRPVIFKHTYDEQNWNVLKERWDDLRAQLHGIIIPDRMANDANEVDKDLIEDLNKNAPNFSP